MKEQMLEWSRLIVVCHTQAKYNLCLQNGCSCHYYTWQRLSRGFLYKECTGIHDVLMQAFSFFSRLLQSFFILLADFRGTTLLHKTLFI